MNHRTMFAKYPMGFSGYGMAVPADLVAQMARKTELHEMCKILDIPFDSTANLDELERKCRLAASGGIPTCVDDLPAEKRAEVIGQIALMQAAGVPVTKDNVSALMREQPFMRMSATAAQLKASFVELARAASRWPEMPEQRERRQATNKRKRERRTRRGSR